VRVANSGISFGRNEEEFVITAAEKHTGPVNSIDFNVNAPNLLASGSHKSEVGLISSNCYVVHYFNRLQFTFIGVPTDVDLGFAETF
jgi:hypothetical protein